MADHVIYKAHSGMICTAIGQSVKLLKLFWTGLTGLTGFKTWERAPDGRDHLSIAFGKIKQ